ncbi:MAG: hypothetical protein KA142_12475, partial [Chromatiaceae bacterium]|nr:hypothetical protein [Chromatiaceae bacterium]
MISFSSKPKVLPICFAISDPSAVTASFFKQSWQYPPDELASVSAELEFATAKLFRPTIVKTKIMYFSAFMIPPSLFCSLDRF